MGLLGAAGLPSPRQLPPCGRGPLLRWRQPKKGLGHFHGNKSLFSNSAKRNCFYLRPLMTWTVHLLQKSNNKKALCCAVTATALSLGLFFAKLTWHPSLFMMHIKKKSFICPLQQISPLGIGRHVCSGGSYFPWERSPVPCVFQC